MYWTLKSIPELRDLPPSQRRLIWNAALAKRLERQPFFEGAGLFVVVILMVVAIDVFEYSVHFTHGQLACIIAGLLFLTVIYWQWRMSRLRRFTWEFLLDVCRACGQRVPAEADLCPGCRAARPPPPTACPRSLPLFSANDGFYWRFKSIPELKNLPTQERNRILKAAMRKSGIRWEVIIPHMCVTAMPIVANHLLRVSGTIPKLCLTVSIVIIQLYYWQWYISIIRAFTWEHLPGLCARCGYNVQASPDRCPECGTEIMRNDGSKD